MELCANPLVTVHRTLNVIYCWLSVYFICHILCVFLSHLCCLFMSVCLSVCLLLSLFYGFLTWNKRIDWLIDWNRCAKLDYLYDLRPMTHMPETGAMCWLQKLCSDFLLVCYSYLVSVLPGTRFWRRLEHCSIPSRKLACTRFTWLKLFVIGRWFTFIFC